MVIVVPAPPVLGVKSVMVGAATVALDIVT
jgi:hypothetical protein